MIFKLTFDDGIIDWCTAKNQLHLLKSYDSDFGLKLQELESVEEISEEEAKKIMVNNTEFDEDNPDEMPEILSIFDLGVGEDFGIFASSYIE